MRSDPGERVELPNPRGQRAETAPWRDVDLLVHHGIEAHGHHVTYVSQTRAGAVPAAPWVIALEPTVAKGSGRLNVIRRLRRRFASDITCYMKQLHWVRFESGHDGT